MEYSAKTRLPLQTLTVSFNLCPYSAISPNRYNLSLIFLLSMGEKVYKGSQVLHFWRLMPKGEKVLSPKQKDRTTISKKNHKCCLFQLGFELASKWIFKWYLIFNLYVKMKFQLVSHFVFQNCFSNWYLFQNPLES